MNVSIEYNWDINNIKKTYYFYPSYVRIKQRHNKYLPKELLNAKDNYKYNLFEINKEFSKNTYYYPTFPSYKKQDIVNSFNRDEYKVFVFCEENKKDTYTIIDTSILLINDEVAIFKKIANTNQELVLYINEKYESNSIVKSIKKKFTNVLIYSPQERPKREQAYSFFEYLENIKRVLRFYE